MRREIKLKTKTKFSVNFFSVFVFNFKRITNTLDTVFELFEC